MRKHRLVTIVGTGGIGKTQAAIRVAADTSADYPDGVWFFDLLAVTSGALIVPEIARLLDIALAPAGDDLSTIGARLKTKRALLLFDNCEHLTSAAGTTISALLRDCSNIAVLATSREPLAVSGEITYRLPPLSIADASALFIARAQAVDSRFAVAGEDELAAVGDLCRKLDGIALAIELAAARTNVFSPRQMLERLEPRFALLEGDLRDVPPRHQSMRAVIDWSYDQLEDRDRALFRRLAIFTGRFSLSSAHAISGIERNAEAEFLDALSSLIDKSLVVAEPENDELSYRLLESTRLYAREKLETHGEAHDVALLALRYLKASLDAITARTKRWMSPEAILFFRRELGDIRSALEWALRAKEVSEGAQLLAATHALWSVNSIREGIAFVNDYLAALGTSDAIVRAKLLSRVGELHWRAGNEDRSIESTDRAVAVAREHADEATLAEALVASAVHSIMRDREKSLRRLREAQALAAMTDEIRNEALNLSARLTYVSDDYELAIPMYRELNEAAKRANDIGGQGECTMVLAIIEYRAGRFERAVEIGRAGVAVLRDGGERWALALSTSTLAGFLVQTGELDDARAVARESLSLYAEIDPESSRIGTVVDIIGYVFAVEGDVTRAAQMQGLAGAIAARPGSVQSRLGSDMAERLETILAGALTHEERAALRARGAALNLEEIMALAGNVPRGRSHRARIGVVTDVRRP